MKKTEREYWMWLDENGELEDVTFEEFMNRTEEASRRKKKWKDAEREGEE